MKKIYTILGIVVLVLPTPTFAVIQNLNGQTGSSQTFINDTNIGINSSNNTHSLTWTGLLAPNRGGTGVNLSTFSPGALLFWNGSSVGQNTSITLDNTNEQLLLGNNFGISIGGVTQINNAQGLDFYNDAGFTENGSLGFDGPDQLSINRASGTSSAVLDLTNINAPFQIFTFPNSSGTFGLVENDQTWTGLNKFEAANNSTLYIGSSVKSGCLVLGDSDGLGVTYITANDGILDATTTKPAICQ